MEKGRGKKYVIEVRGKGERKRCKEKQNRVCGWEGGGMMRKKRKNRGRKRERKKIISWEKME